MNKTSLRTRVAVCAALTSFLMTSPAMALTADSWSDVGASSGQAKTADIRSKEAVASSTAAVKTAAATKRPKVALALGGGGMRGAAHVGVLRVLTDAGIPIDYIAGTSMGSIVGGLYSAGVPLNALEKKFDDRSLMTAFMTVPLWFRILVAPIMITPRLLGRHPYDGLYYGNKFRKYLERSVPESEQNIEALKIPFCAVALNLVTGKERGIKKGKLGYALQASSAVPGLRKPVQIGEELFVDGGVVDNVPVNEAHSFNPDVVIAVDVDERFDEVPLDTFRKIGSVSKRMVTLQLARIDSYQEKNADIIIHPNVDGIGLVSTSAKDAKKAIAAGEKAAREALPSIKAKLESFGWTAAKVDREASADTH